MKTWKNNFTVRLILLMVLGTLIGIFASRIQIDELLLSLNRNLEAFYFNHAFTIYLVLPLALTLLALGAYFRGKKQVTEDLALDRDLLREGSIKRAKLCMHLASVFNFFFFMLYMATSLHKPDDAFVDRIFLALVYFILLAVFLVYFQKRLVDFIHSYRPDLYSDTLSFSYAKKRLESSDEREQLEIYRAGYKAFTILMPSIGVCSLLLFFVSTVHFVAWPPSSCSLSSCPLAWLASTTILCDQKSSSNQKAIKKNLNRFLLLHFHLEVSLFPFSKFKNPWHTSPKDRRIKALSVETTFKINSTREATPIARVKAVKIFTFNWFSFNFLPPISCQLNFFYPTIPM